MFHLSVIIVIYVNTLSDITERGRYQFLENEYKCEYFMFLEAKSKNWHSKMNVEVADFFWYFYRCPLPKHPHHTMIHVSQHSHQGNWGKSQSVSGCKVFFYYLYFRNTFGQNFTLLSTKIA